MTWSYGYKYKNSDYLSDFRNGIFEIDGNTIWCYGEYDIYLEDRVECIRYHKGKLYMDLSIYMKQ